MEGFDGENATTTAEIHPNPPLPKEGDEQGTPSTSSETRIVKTGKILVFVNLGYSKLDTEIASAAQGGLAMTDGSRWTIDQQTGKVTAAFTAGLNLKGNSLENVSQILSANGTWSIDENGELVVKKVESEELWRREVGLILGG